MKNSSMFLGILGILVLVVAASGCTSTGSTQLTYTDGVISFNYTDDFHNGTPPADITSGGATWQKVAYMVNNDGTQISVEKNSQPAITPAIAKTATVNGAKQISTGKLLSSTTKTNPNGIVVEQTIMQATDPSSNTVLRYIDMFFTAGGVTYSTSVWGDDSKNQQITETNDLIFNTLKT